MEQFVLVDNELQFYCAYIQSLIDPEGTKVFPVLTRFPEITYSLLEKRDVPCVFNSANQFSREVLDLGTELISMIEQGEIVKITQFYNRLKEKVSSRGQTTLSYVIGVGRSAGLGALRALADGREFLAVESLQDEKISHLRFKAKSLYVVVEDLKDEDVVYLQNASNSEPQQEIFEGVRAFGIGYLHARNFEMMTYLDAKQRFGSLNRNDNPVDLIIDSFLSEKPRRISEDVIAVPYQEVSRETIAGQSNINLLSITSHGMSDLIHLNSDYICGKSPYLNVSEFKTAKIPSCMEEGGFCFFKKSGNPILAHEIQADHVFINSCGSLRFRESNFDPLFNVSYTVLEGQAKSFVGSIRWKDGHGSESLLYYHLLKSGFTLGEAAFLLNHSLFSNQFESTNDVFYLIGDPDEKLENAIPAQRFDELSEGENRIRIEGGFKILKISSPTLIKSFFDCQLFIWIKNKKSLFVSSIPTTTQEALYVFLYAYEDIADEFIIEVNRFHKTYLKVLEKYQLIEQNLSPSLGLNRLYPNWIKQGGKKNLENRILNISRLYKSSFTDPNMTEKLYSSCKKFLDEVDQLDVEIAQALYDSISKTSFRFSEHYQDNFLLKTMEEEKRCYICGKKLIHRYLRHILRPSLFRVEMICTNCGGIEDKPDLLFSMQINFDELFKRNSVHKVTVRLTNDSEKEYDGFNLVSVRRSAEYAVCPKQAIQRVSVKPRAALDVEFDMEIGKDVPVHQYNIQTAFVSTTQIFLATRSFWVTR
ncbi:hypothetical protein [Effusibacillus consociatus]|uniref:Uncharacterized protein n=1 Tax=Effusibacillus consociatus TaxID=1117041 RepID=A0ABV9Q8S6_9BACL